MGQGGTVATTIRSGVVCTHQLSLHIAEFPTAYVNESVQCHCMGARPSFRVIISPLENYAQNWTSGDGRVRSGGDCVRVVMDFIGKVYTSSTLKTEVKIGRSLLSFCSRRWGKTQRPPIVIFSCDSFRQYSALERLRCAHDRALVTRYSTGRPCHLS